LEFAFDMKKIFSVVIATAVLVACTREEITPRHYPRMMSRGVSEVDANGILVKGEIMFTPGAIDDHGFVWTSLGFPKIDGYDKLSLGPRDNTGVFEARIERNLGVGQTYSIRPYATYGDMVVYGETMKFDSKGCRVKPTITSFSPTEGAIGDIITIDGATLSRSAESSTVMLGSAVMQIVETSESQIRFKILYNQQSGPVDLTVTVNGYTLTPGKFTLL
jgi:hypothetical protein